MALHANDQAPSFSLYSSDEEAVALEDFRGRAVILVFFPFAYYKKANEAMKLLRKNHRKYGKLGADIIGVSADSPFALARYKKSNRLRFTLLSDFNREVCRSYGAILEEYIYGMREVPRLSAFLIDGKGTVIHADPAPDSKKTPDFVIIEEKLRELSE